MALYRCEVRKISRSQGRSAVAAAAYRAGARLEDSQTGKAHDYRRRSGVRHSELFIPARAPFWAHDRAELWNQAQAAEHRRNSVLAREVLLALPHELTPEERAQLARGFALWLARRYGVAVDLAIHAPDRRGDSRNHHAHILLTTRRLTAQGFGAKTREWDDIRQGPCEVEGLRAAWCERCNAALQRQGIRLEHRRRVAATPPPKRPETRETGLALRPRPCYQKLITPCVAP